MSEDVVFDIHNGLHPTEVARRVSSIVVGNRDTWEKNDHAWFFGEQKEWTLIRVTHTRYTLRFVSGYTLNQQEALKAVIEWRVNESVNTSPTNMFFPDMIKSDEMIFGNLAYDSIHD